MFLRVAATSPVQGFTERFVLSASFCDQHLYMKLKLPAGQFKAYLFDCDGTIADSMGLHYLAWSRSLAEQSCEFSEDLFYALGGMSVAEIIARLNRERGLKMPAADVEKRKEELYLESLSQLKAIPAVLEHIEASHGKIPLAVVSGAREIR